MVLCSRLILLLTRTCFVALFYSSRLLLFRSVLCWSSSSSGPWGIIILFLGVKPLIDRIQIPSLTSWTNLSGLIYLYEGVLYIISTFIVISSRLSHNFFLSLMYLWYIVHEIVCLFFTPSDTFLIIDINKILYNTFYKDERKSW